MSEILLNTSGGFNGRGGVCTNGGGGRDIQVGGKLYIIRQ